MKRLILTLLFLVVSQSAYAQFVEGHYLIDQEDMIVGELYVEKDSTRSRGTIQHWVIFEEGTAYPNPQKYPNPHKSPDPDKLTFIKTDEVYRSATEFLRSVDYQRGDEYLRQESIGIAPLPTP